MTMDTHNYVFIGEAGSGKTEISANIALHLAQKKKAHVCLIDMDQTKCLFRARDFSSILEAGEVHMAKNPELWDTPLMPEGVTAMLRDDNICCVFDAGGNAVGAAMLGQYAPLLAEKPTRYFYVINPCRAFSDGMAEIAESMGAIVGAARIPMKNLEIIVNPYMGTFTTAELIMEYYEKLKSELAKGELHIAGLAVSKKFAGVVKKQVELPILELDTYVDKLYV